MGMEETCHGMFHAFLLANVPPCSPCIPSCQTKRRKFLFLERERERERDFKREEKLQN
jgi:hypothetical protein